VCEEGNVSLITKDVWADKFDSHTLHVKIAAQAYHRHYEFDRFVFLVEDLDKFCTSWFYSNLSNPYLNSHLNLTLTLRDPFTPADAEKKIPQALQQRLLLPFGKIKELRSLEISGSPKPLPSIEQEMRATMAIPLASPSQCLIDATSLKDQGNTELKSNRPTAALELYRQAWHAIHIIVDGRHRVVHGDPFFDCELTTPPFSGKNGSAERTILRIRLVANTVLAYLMLKDHDTAKFIGLRTIKILRYSIGVDEDEGADDAAREAFTSFFAAGEMGKIYYRTALACKELDDKAEARRLLKVAVLYLPNDPAVQRELAACALRI